MEKQAIETESEREAFIEIFGCLLMFWVTCLCLLVYQTAAAAATVANNREANSIRPYLLQRVRCLISLN